MSAETTWFAPGRVNLVGEHTDYNDGYVLPLALTLGTTVRATSRDDRTLRIMSAQEPGDVVTVTLDGLVPGAVGGWAAYVAGTAWALAQHGVHVPGADLQVDSTVPRGAGLSSSAALECATAGALLDLAGVRLGPLDVALLAQRAENEFVGMPCGLMDQAVSVLAQQDHLLLLDARSHEHRQVPFDLAGHGLALLVLDTRAPHVLVDGGYAARRAQCEEAARLLGVAALRDVDDLDTALARLDDDRLRRRVRHVVTEDARVLDVVALLEAGRVREIGPLLTASHASLRDDFAVSCRELDLAVATALEAGALGARMTGGGFGGSAIALVDAATAEDVRSAVAQAFATAALEAPVVVWAVPGPGYRRA
jgi:galactokinase